MGINSQTIGLIGVELHFDNQIYIFRAVREAVHNHNINMIYIAGEGIRSPYAFKIQANILYDLVKKQTFQGLIIASSIIGTHVTKEDLKNICKAYHPIPVISIGVTLEGFPGIIIDNTQGMYDAVSHLIEIHGYKHIGYICGPGDHPDAQQRYLAYTRAMEDHNLPINPDLILPGDFRHYSGIHAISILIDERQQKPGKDFDALVATNDYMAIGAIMELQDRGFKIPEDIAVTGFDDVLMGKHFFPTLSTVQQPFYKMGQLAAELLFSCLNKEYIPDIIKMPTVFIPRRSCGCVDTTENKKKHTDQLSEDIKNAVCSRPREFLRFLSHRIFVANLPDHILNSWNPVLTILSQPEKWEGDASGEQKEKNSAKNIWTLLGSTAYTFFRTYRETKNLVNLGTDLTSTLVIPQFIDKLTNKLPEFEIRCCYIVLYEKPPPFIYPQKIPQYSRLILAFDEIERIDLPPEGLRFLSHNLLPQDILKNRKSFNMVIEALYFRETQIGFYLIDAYAMDEEIYQVLREQISSSLHSALLLKRIRKQMNKLAIAHRKIQNLNELLKKENVRMHTEISVAKHIQHTLLPDKVREIHPDFEISAGIVTAPGVAGDYYDISLDRNGSLWLGIGDVAGQGLPAGLIMMIAQTVHTTLTTNFQVSAQDIIEIVNNVLYKNVNQRMGDTRFMTMTQLKYLGKGRFQYAGLHQDILVYRKKNRTCQSIRTSGMWLNIIPDIHRYTKNDEFTIGIGDILILYTNGMTDTYNSNMKLLDLSGLKEIIITHSEKDVDAMQDAIIKDVSAWCEKQVKDDMSLILAKRIQQEDS